MTVEVRNRAVLTLYILTYLMTFKVEIEMNTFAIFHPVVVVIFQETSYFSPFYCKGVSILFFLLIDAYPHPRTLTEKGK